MLVLSAATRRRFDTAGSTELQRRKRRPAWLRPDLVPGKGQFRSRFHHPLSYCCPTTIFGIPATDTDIISGNTSGRAGWNGWARLLRCGRDRSGGGFPNAGYEPHPSCGDCPLTARSRAKKSGQNILKNCETLCSFLGRHPNDRVTSDPGVFSSTLPPAHNPTRPGGVTSLTPFDYRQLSRCRRHVQQRRPGQRIGVVANMRRIDPLQHDCARIVIYGDDSGRHAAK